MNPSNYQTKRLTKDTNYKRPKKTFQESLTNDEIKEKLKGYKKINDITKIIIGSHLRYFTKDIQKKDVFRLGGFLSKFGEDYKYVVLQNGNFSWSVQLNGTNEFWVKMNPKDIHEQIQTEVEEIVNDKYKKKYEDMKNQSDYVLKMFKKQQIENEKLKKKIDAIEEVAKKDKNKKK